METERNSWIHKHSLATYLILANGITWLCWIPGMVVSYRSGAVLPNFDTYITLFQTGFADPQHLFTSILFQLGVYGPLLAALVATWLDGGHEGLFSLWRRIINWRVGLRWYLIILAIAILLAAIPVGIAALAGLTQFNPSGSISLFALVVLLSAQILTSGLGEEPGWRGFLLPKLKARSSGQKYIWLLGFIWAVWHYPFTIYTTLGMMQGVTPIQAIITILVALLGFTMSLIGMTFLYVWLVNSTQSVFIAIIFHALTNVIPLYIHSFFELPVELTVVIGFMPWVLVILLRIFLGGKRFPGPNDPI